MVWVSVLPTSSQVPQLQLDVRLIQLEVSSFSADPYQLLHSSVVGVLSSVVGVLSFVVGVLSSAVGVLVEPQSKVK